jgi:putative transposase
MQPGTLTARQYHPPLVTTPNQRKFSHKLPYYTDGKESSLERMILLGESGVRKATAEFMAHYHSERNHQGLANVLICPEPEHAAGEGEVHRRERLGGLLNYYYRKAA